MTTPLPTPPAAAPALSGGTNLDPTTAQLLAFTPDWPMLALLVLSAGAYFWSLARARRSAEGQARWPLWKVALFTLGLVLWYGATQTGARAYTGQSMALYMARLMVLAEVVPPLLVLGLPRNTSLTRESPLGRFLGLLLDPGSRSRCGRRSSSSGTFRRASTPAWSATRRPRCCRCFTSSAR